jgi:N-methylhydantoinase A
MPAWRMPCAWFPSAWGDPRDFALFAFGGAGPLHASAIARELGVPKVFAPSRPGIINALGCMVADLRHDFVNTINRPVASVDIELVRHLFEQQSETGRQLIGKEAVAIREIREICSVDMQFIGQTHLLRVALPDGKPSREDLQKRFEEAYFLRFHVELPEIRANLVNVNTSVIGRRDEIDLSALIDVSGRKSNLADAQTGSRSVWFDRFVETPVYWRDHLPLDAVIQGPAIIEQMDTIILIEPEDQAVQDRDGNIIISVGGGQ